MGNPFFQQQISDTQQKRGFSVFSSLLPLMRHSVNWLAGLFMLTKEEQEDAGVYLRRLGDE